MEFKHPKYYKELAKIRREFQKSQATSVKTQAASDAGNVKTQAAPDAGRKPQAPSGKAQASSRKHQDPWLPSPHKVLLS